MNCPGFERARRGWIKAKDHGPELVRGALVALRHERHPCRPEHNIGICTDISQTVELVGDVVIAWVDSPAGARRTMGPHTCRCPHGVIIISDVLQAQHQRIVDVAMNVESEGGHAVVHFDDPVVTLVVRIIPEMDLPKRERRASQDVEVVR